MQNNREVIIGKVGVFLYNYPILNVSILYGLLLDNENGKGINGAYSF